MTPTSAITPFRQVLAGASSMPPPIWLMRQAGRYLPEYRALRAKAGNFLDLCYTPDFAVEATLQPIRRFDFDAAILFSDILVVPHALGQDVSFVESIGPVLAPIRDVAAVRRLRPDDLAARLRPVYEAVSRLRATLPAKTSLIGFAGAPWTVATYMVEGGTSRDHAHTKRWAFREPESFALLIELLVAATARHLIAEVAAGVDVLQLFDTWAGALPAHEMHRWCLAPARAIMQRVHAVYPDVPFILFPRGVGPGYADFAQEPGCRGLSLDSSVPLAWAAKTLQPHKTIQGNLDPQLLVIGGRPMREAAERLRAAFGERSFIVNLGHGVVPETPPEHVGELVAIVRSWRA